MPPGEFELIERYFTGRGARRVDVELGVGDDAAILAPRPGSELVMAIDTIVAGVHFPAGTAGRFVGHRVLAVNLSDLAAMGADPAWALLALTLPAVDEPWLDGFASALDDLARRFGVALVGGDTTHGPLAASLAVAGWAPAGTALRRRGAKPGDDVWISGTTGDAGAGLAILEGRLEADGPERDELLRRFLLPEPRIGLGQALRGIATACIDVSDGLAGDLAQLCRASRAGAEIDAATLPISAALRHVAGETEALRLALSAGDDYELLFAAPADARPRIAGLDPQAPASRIGRIVATPGVRVQGAALIRETVHGFDHFAD